MKRKKKQNKAELQNQPASEEVSSQVSLDLNPDGVSDGDDSLQTAAETDSAGEAPGYHHMEMKRIINTA